MQTTLGATAVDHRRALGDRVGDVLLRTVEVRVSGDRTHVGVVAQRIADLEGLRALR